MKREETSQKVEKSEGMDMLKLDSQLCFPLYAAARQITNIYSPVLKPYGLTYTQYLVFLVLWEKDGQPVGELCRRLHLDTGTLTPVLKKMAAAGWIKRERSTVDERIVIISLTEQGRNFKKEAEIIPEKVGACLAMTSTDAKMLYDLLYKLLAGMKEIEERS